MKRWFALAQLLAVLALVAAPGFALASEGGGGGEHAGGHHEGINWYYGNLMEKEDLEHPTVLFRPKGMPAPVSALLINTAVLYFILLKMLGPVIRDGLKKRKQDIMGGMDEAAKMKEKAALRLKEYQDKLKHIDDEVERVRTEMRATAHAEREQILREAKERRARMERDAKLLIEQELKAAREELMQETVRAAVSRAGEMLTKQLSSADQQRIADEYLSELDQPLNASGGQA